MNESSALTTTQPTGTKNELTEYEENQFSIVEPSTLEIMERAQIDVQIATAHRYPRSMAMFTKRALAMVSIDEDTAASCMYRRPVGKEKGNVVYAEGESIRMAEIVAASFGNLRASARIVEQTERKVVCVGIAHDLETNYAAQVEAVEVTLYKDGNPYPERMRMLIAKATLSKAFRDAVFRVVPRSLCKPITEHAKKVAIGDASTLVKRRQAVLDWMNKAGINAERVFARLEIGGVEDIDLAHLELLTGLKTAIKEGDTTVDDAFPPVTQKAATKAQAALPAAKVATPATTPKPAPAPAAAPTPAPVAEEKPKAPAQPEPVAPAAPTAPAAEAPTPAPAAEPPAAAAGTAEVADEDLESTIAAYADEAGITFDELEAWARGNNLLTGNKTMADLTTPKLRKMLEGWDEAKKQILAKRPQ